jgi:CubicO group peptidase (beta-lactamase class C family)
VGLSSEKLFQIDTVIQRGIKRNEIAGAVALANHPGEAWECGIGDLEVAPGVGFGLGFSVITDRGLARSVWSNGSYAWGGFFHTAFQIDPQEELIAIFLCQLRPDNHLQLDQKVIQMAAQSIID